MPPRAGAIAALGFLAIVALSPGRPALAASEYKIPNADLTPLDFAALEGWAGDDHLAAFRAFMKSCKPIAANGASATSGGLVQRALADLCRRAVQLASPAAATARAFFEQNFRPVRVTRSGETAGFYTGYYETEYDGSRQRGGEYQVPVYSVPRDAALRARVLSMGRNDIEDGALAGKGLEICWLKSPVDLFFAQIQGSARIRLAGGGQLRLNFAAKNDRPYTAVGRFLVERGIVSKEDISMDRIRDFMETHPDEGHELRRKNQSYVFFREVALGPQDQPPGAQGVPLTPGRSIAIDHSIHAFGTPVWIDARLPIASEKPETPFRHLMVAQDTGSAILGPARADIYFGSGEAIGQIAGRIKQPGQFVVLLPRGIAVSASPATAVPK